tara:strand:- start:2269 stop:2541 length:273 start_codon:yes stop_codon:yes gene_type:complete
LTPSILRSRLLKEDRLFRKRLVFSCCGLERIEKKWIRKIFWTDSFPTTLIFAGRLKKSFIFIEFSSYLVLTFVAKFGMFIVLKLSGLAVR